MTQGERSEPNKKVYTKNYRNKSYMISVYNSLRSSTSHGDATFGGVMLDVPIQEYYRTSWSNKIIQVMAGFYKMDVNFVHPLYKSMNNFSKQQYQEIGG
jgi:hypothetical protein